ncbi:hypothetical protein BD779DRAFT_1804110 [Infundibulicybe gibba]|nr:hypothetical protein BD779DRAFT_1804110 [Infundibulicybe gibba]
MQTATRVSTLAKTQRWSMLHHARNGKLHLHCTEDCPANPRRKGPVLVRSVNQAEWIKWAEVFFDELHEQLDRNLGRNHPENFNHLGDWMLPIPADGGGDGAMAELLNNEGNGSEDEDGMGMARKWSGSLDDSKGGADGKKEGKRAMEWSELSSLDDSVDDTDAARSSAPQNSDNCAAPSPSAQPTTAPAVANWHPANAFSACNHTCAQTSNYLAEARGYASVHSG